MDKRTSEIIEEAAKTAAICGYEGDNAFIILCLAQRIKTLEDGYTPGYLHSPHVPKRKA